MTSTSLRPAAPAPVRAAFLILLSSVMLCQRLGLNLGSYSLNATLITEYLFVTVASFSGALVIHPRRLLAFAAAAGVALMSLLANDAASSPSSLLLLVTIYAPFVFSLREEATRGMDIEWAVTVFLRLALFLAVVGIAQFYLQFVIKAVWLFDFSDDLPAILRGPSGYHTVIPMGELHKSNGFFFREPSGFSLVMAFALMLEFGRGRRASRIAPFTLALLLTYSGTGLLAVIVGASFPFGRRAALALGLGALVGTVAVLFGDVLNLSFTIARLREFGTEGSSAYVRYVAPLRLIVDTFHREPMRLILGHGPGAISRLTLGYEFHDPTWAKLVFEYGLLGFFAFLSLFLMVLRAGKVFVRFRAILLVAWLTMGGHLLSPDFNCYVFALVGLSPRGGRAIAEPKVDGVEWRSALVTG
ncbi:MAG TPA: hypothetical protein VHU40_20080 [Polyangia bacterium]|nr:hypothetical protein [Polyangia bacterium]